ncbi:MAG TPA: 4Fe-4S binding protein [Peptococcaceae bacterium]|nr:4Fe-4S binding protein [Peptococcaceae bacterium]
MLRRVKLGLWGPEVSEVCFGSLAISPLQGRVSEKEGREILRYAVQKGVNWIDTAEIYDNYAQLKPVLQEYPELKIVTKSYSVTEAELKHSLEKARRELGRDFIDIFLLHEQENHLTLQGHAGAWEELQNAKAKGLVGFIGISTHAVQGVRGGALQPGLDIIHPLLNYKGLGIIDGSLHEMLQALEFASQLGIGLYAMKVFGGGHLTGEPEKALKFIRSIPGVQAMALGMSSTAEVDFNLAVLDGQEISPELRQKIRQRERKLYIADWCQGCGNCVNICPQGALNLSDGQATVKQERCVFCGYCGRVCPHFCLKIV